MLMTPFGKIVVTADDVRLDVQAMAHTYDRPPVKGHPIAGCYRIHVPADHCRSVRCEIEFTNTSIPNTGASGEKYMDAEFICGSTALTIGAENENPAFEAVRNEHGMEYIIHSSVPKVVFGIAWATDYEGTFDARTWFAADPTLDK